MVPPGAAGPGRDWVCKRIIGAPQSSHLRAGVAGGTSMKMEEVEGIGPIEAEKLALAGIATAEALLEMGAKPGGRAAIEKATGLSSVDILKWVNRVDLMRIKGVGSEYSDLLEAAGVDSPAELAQRNPANLATTFQEVVAARPDIVRRVPTESELSDWISQSKDLEKVVEH